MKAVLEKALNVIGGYSRSNNPSQRRDNPVGKAPQDLPQCIINHDSNSPYQVPLSTFSTGGNTGEGEGDGILFSKNNVLLKHPSQDLTCQTEARGEEASYRGVGPNAALDNHILVPGFLFVTTRGCNFGTTLILNWAPNSSMKVPGDSSIHTANQATYSMHPASNDDHSIMHKCSSVSIDLCLMEMIRIFYRMDDSGFIISGELVVKSKEETFKVRT